MTTTSSRALKPSSSTRSWLSVWSCSRWKPPPMRAVPTASSSSMKMIAGAVLARLLEELADARGAEPGEHLDERRGALRVEVRARRARDRLREQRLPRSRRPVQEDASWHAGAEALEALAVAEELDDLLELLLRLVEAGDVVPRHLHLRPAHDRRRLRARHEPQRVEEQDDDDPEEHDREPGQERVLEIHLQALSAARRTRSAGSDRGCRWRLRSRSSARQASRAAFATSS